MTSIDNTKRPSCQEVINEIRRIKSLDINSLTREEKDYLSSVTDKEKNSSIKTNTHCLKPHGYILYADYLGREISVLEWALALEKGDPLVGIDKIGPYTISTVWLGINHSLFLQDLQIFETIIFDEKGHMAFGRYQERYGTLEEAKRGHALAYKYAKKNS